MSKYLTSEKADRMERAEVERRIEMVGEQIAQNGRDLLAAVMSKNVAQGKEVIAEHDRLAAQLLALWKERELP